MFTYSGILIILLFLGSGISLILLSIFVYRRYRSRLSKIFLVLVFSCSVWIFFHLLELVFPSRFGTLLWGRLKYLGIVVVPVAWLSFALQYTGRRKHVSWRNAGFLLLIPIVVLCVLWTNGYHHLFYGEIVIEELGGLTYFSAGLGPFFWLNALYIYILIIFGIFLILRALSNLHKQYWKQAIVIAVGILVPLLGNIIYVSTSTSPRLDITPLLFLPASISLAFGMRNFNFLDALLIGRKTVFEETSNAILVLDNTGNVIDLNKAGEELVEEIGSYKDVIGEKAGDILSGKLALTSVLNARREIKREFELETDRNKRYFEAQIDPLRKSRENQVGWNITVRDITERKKAEKELKKYAEGVNAADDSIYMVDKDYRYVLANEEHLSRLVEDGRISRKNEDELTGKKYHEVHPEKDSRMLEEKVDKVMETGESIKLEHEFSSVDRWSSRTYSPVKDPETEEIDGVIVVSKDITERRKAEEREEFLHSLLRHDVRNKAQIVRGYLELLEETDLSEEQEELVEKARKGSVEGIDVIEKVRTLRSIGREEEIEEVSIGSIIENVISERESQIQEKGMEIKHEGVSCKVLGGSLLEELFSNLIENSIQHSGGNKIRISSQETENECIVIVEDDGRGIPDKDKDKIFDRGFKSGETGGSGLGMHLVKQIGESYDGGIKVKDSELGGARFDVHLKKA